MKRRDLLKFTGLSPLVLMLPEVEAQAPEVHWERVLVLVELRGGLYGQQPSLTNLEDGDMRHVVDYRSLYVTVARRWWGLTGDFLQGGIFPCSAAWRKIQQHIYNGNNRSENASSVFLGTAS